MDRVASPWLIKRFVDPDAEFGFLPFGNEFPLPDDAIPFAIPGVELGPHDAAGSTFRKIMLKYALTDPALEILAKMIESGVTHVFHHHEPDYSVGDLPYAEGVGLDSLAAGMMYACQDDADNVAKSVVIYDGLYAYCRSLVLLEAHPELKTLPVPRIWDAIRAGLRN